MFLSTIEDLNGGFAVNYEQCADSHGPVKAVMIFVDFPGRLAGDSAFPDTKYYEKLLGGDGLKVLKDVSYGRLQLTIDYIPHWFTMPKADKEYGMERVITAETHRAYIQDAMDVSCKEVDYRLYDILYIVPVEGSAVPYSPTLVDQGNPLYCASGSIGLCVTFGADLYKRKGKLLAHETGHIMGLPDLYTYEVTEGADTVFGHCGTWSLMGSIEGLAPDYLAYSKWRLGFVTDDQVETVREEKTVLLTPLEVGGGLKLIVMPMDAYHGICVEYRTPTGLDAALPEDGLIVYAVDGTVESGRGCITVLSPKKGGTLRLSPRTTDGLLKKGDCVTFGNITVESLGKGNVHIFFGTVKDN